MMNKLLGIIFPRKCVGCGASAAHFDDVFCDECRVLYERMKSVYCARCGKFQDLCRCGPDKPSSDVSRYIHLIEYSSPISRSIIFTLKDKNIKALRIFLAEELSNALIAAGNETDGTYITYAPRSRERLTKFGFDQSRELAKFIASDLHLRPVTLFARRGGKLQKHLGRQSRMVNAAYSFLPATDERFDGKRLIIVDDVVTSGGTTSALAALARQMGFSDVTVLFVAQTPLKLADRA